MLICVQETNDRVVDMGRRGNGEKGETWGKGNGERWEMGKWGNGEMGEWENREMGRWGNE